MVAINNNLTEKFKILSSKNSLEQNDELFAELFALMNSNVENNEEKNLLKNIMVEPTDKTKDELSVIPNQIKEQSNTSESFNTDNELELAKSLIKIFYKEFGIDDSASQPKANENPKTINQLHINIDGIKKKITKSILQNEKKSNEMTNQKNESEKDFKLSENIILKIEKKKPTESKLKQEKLDNFFKSNKTNNFDSLTSHKKQEPYEKEKINKNLNVIQNSSLIEKKTKKKNKQFSKNIKNTNENLNLSINENKSFIKTDSNFVQKIQNPRENKISVKKETVEKNEFKLSENKQTFSNQNGKEFLNLLESSWGEKFSQIVKNSLKNGISKVEIELKPHNLGKLNLEVSLKNNKTFINISSENQEVLNILNENLPRFTEIIEKESKSFSSLFNNDGHQNSSFNGNNKKDNLVSQENLKTKKEGSDSEVNKISNHNIDVNA